MCRLDTHLHLYPCILPAGLFSAELFKSSQAYSIDKWHFNFLHGQYNLVEQVAQLWFGFLPWLWYSLPSILPQQLVANEVTRSVCFVLLMSTISLLMNLPWSYYSTCKPTCLSNSLLQQQHLCLHGRSLPACLARHQLRHSPVRCAFSTTCRLPVSSSSSSSSIGPTHRPAQQHPAPVARTSAPRHPQCLLCAVVIEERHGFNKQTKALFFMDLVKSALLGLVLLPPLVGGFTWLLQRAGPWVPLQLWAFFFSVAVVMMSIYPTCEQHVQ